MGGKVRVASHKMSAGFVPSIADGKAVFAIDRQRGLRGSLPVDLRAQAAGCGTMPAGNIAGGSSCMSAGNAGNAARVIALSAEGIRQGPDTLPPPRGEGVIPVLRPPCRRHASLSQGPGASAGTTSGLRLGIGPHSWVNAALPDFGAGRPVRRCRPVSGRPESACRFCGPSGRKGPAARLPRAFGPPRRPRGHGRGRGRPRPCPRAWVLRRQGSWSAADAGGCRRRRRTFRCRSAVE